MLFSCPDQARLVWAREHYYAALPNRTIYIYGKLPHTNLPHYKYKVLHANLAYIT